MKIAVCSIALNEEKFVQRWADSCADADYRLILDTGSTDDTYALAYGMGIDTHQQVFSPWRFDHARNHLMGLIPDDTDYIIWLDMDEILEPGWRQILESVPTHVTRPRYKYVWSRNEDGSEGLVYGGDKICSRNGYRWVHPCHEVLQPVGITEYQQFMDGFQISHYPDPTKSRSQYLPLLKIAVEEDPKDSRNQFYLARELYFHGDHGLAQYHFSRHLELSLWNPERAASHRYLAKMRPDAAEFHLYRAIAEDPNRRESWVALAVHYHQQRNWLRCRMAAEQALAITEKPLDYLCEADAWGWLPHDLMAIACHHLGDSDEAFQHGATACALNPTDARLQANLSFYRL